MTLQAIGLVGGRGPHAHAQPLFTGVEFSLDEGEALRVTGRNGSGKTTLLRTLCGLSEPQAGTLLWRGVPVWRTPTHGHPHEHTHGHPTWPQDVRYIGHAAGLKGDLSALENLRFAQALAGRSCTEAQAARALQALGLGSHAVNALARTLSQGQQRRAVLARLALPSDLDPPGLLVLDEPFNALDATSVAVLTDLLAQRLAQGAILVYTTHQGQGVPARRTQAWHLGPVHETEVA